MAELAETRAPLSIATPAFVAVPARSWRGFWAWPVSKQILLLILVIYCAKEGLAVAIFPPFSGHDEVAHFAYIETVATEHRVPVIVDLNTFQTQANRGGKAAGDYMPDSLYRYCGFVLDWFCNLSPVLPWAAHPPHTVSWLGAFYPSGWQYAANHPPLYYVLMAPVYKLLEHKSPAFQQHAIRVATIPFGMIVVIFAFLLTQVLFPGDLFMASTVTALVAFQPQISYEAAMVNNDIAGIAAFSVMLYLLARGIRFGVTWRLAVLIGATLGIGLLFKSTMATALPLIAVAIVMGCGWKRYRDWIAKGAVSGAFAGLMVWPWYLFLHRTYGNFSGLDQVKALQYLHTYQRETPPTIWSQLFNRDFAMLRWRETWGEFGWRLIHLHRILLWVIGAPFIAALIGLVWYAVAQVRRRDEILRAPRADQASATLLPARWQVQAVGLLCLTCVAAYYSILQFGLTFSLTQARYAFPAVNAFALVSMLGLRAIIPRRHLRYAQAIIVFLLLALNFVIFTQYVIPYWYLPN